MDFLAARREFGLGAAIDDVHFGAQAQGRAGRVHRDVAAAHDAHLLAGVDRGEIILAPGLHQVVAGEELVGGEDAVEVLAGDVHELGQAGTGAHEDGFEAFVVHQGVDGDGTAHDDVGLDLDAERADGVDLVAQDLVFRKAEFGDAVFKHAAGFVERLEDGDVVAPLRQIARARQTCRAAADDSNLFAAIS